MKVFVTGANGQLGHDVVAELSRRGLEAVASGLSESRRTPWDEEVPYVQLNITDTAAVERVLREVRPDAVIHCAAWTAVDLAEDHRDEVFRVNAGGTGDLARLCRELGCKMMYLSTDYVFGGQGSEPWRPECREFMPLNVYGQSKLAGERIVEEMLEKFFIVRVAWVFGRCGTNFVKTMLELGRKNRALRVVCDQIGTPTYTGDLARLLVDMIVTEQYGYYHATNGGGYISWHEFACEIFRRAGMDVEVAAVTTAEYGQSRALRPLNSRMDRTKLAQSGFAPLPPWQDALGRYLEEIGV